MEDAIKTEKMGELTIEIHQDDMDNNPREWDNLGTMVCFHRRYDFGDKKHGFNGPEDLQKKLDEKDCISLPIYMMDHSGLTIKTDPMIFQAMDSQGWDWGKLGYIFADAEKIRKEYSCKRITKAIREKVLEVLNQEIETFNQYVQGDVYFFLIKDESGNVLDSCGGMFGLDYCLEQAKENANGITKDLTGSGAGI
jgi:hypothetical protein